MLQQFLRFRSPATRRAFSSVTTHDGLLNLLESVRAGTISPDKALTSIRNLETEEVGGYARIDHHRTLRTGFPEVIFGDGKTPAQIANILVTLRAKQHPMIMATRVSPEAHAEIQVLYPDSVYYSEARILAVMENKVELERKSNPEEGREEERGGGCPALPSPTRTGTIAVLAAGTCDLPVAEEAVITASLYGHRVERLYDVGVAGIHRLLSKRSMEIMRRADVLIVAAGMEGALPSVVAGLVDSPVVALPTSVGYGASFQGVTPLLTMLSSCAPGIGVVNIDNGFGAAALACAILRVGEKQERVLLE
jgi:NCAIR mutase (PurE)-related protein